MRPRIVLPVLGLGLVLAFAAWLLRPGRGEPPALAPPPTVAAVQPEGAAPSSGAPARAAQPGLDPAAAPLRRPAADSNAPDMDSPEARQQAYVQERIDQLMDLAMDDQPASLDIILGELTNRDPDIRQAAVQAAMQFGSREAIPKLREAADQTDDIREKAAIQDAIEFLEVASPAEVAAGGAAANAPPAPNKP